MTTDLYFVRHAEPDYSHRDDMTRPLTEKGRQDCALVSHFLTGKGICAVISSPYQRAYDTVAPFAQAAGLPIACEFDLRERKITDGWLEDFTSYAKRAWEDFTYKLPNGESLAEVQQRNMAVVHRLLAQYKGKAIAIGTHGTSLATVLQHYNRGYGYEDFCRLQTPYIVHLSFNGEELCDERHIDVFAL